MDKRRQNIDPGSGIRYRRKFLLAATIPLVLTIAAIALTVFVISEVSVRRNWIALWAIPATFCIGVSCGLPLYLFLRTRPIS